MRRSDGGSDASVSDASDAAEPERAQPGTPGAADVGDIRQLLEDLSQLRLSLSADLSAAAGALEAGRRDVAGSMVDSARRELAEMRTAAVARGQVVTAPSAAVGPATPPPHRVARRPLRRPARALAGAVALALAVVVLPHLAAGKGSSSRSTVAGSGLQPGSSPTVNIRLVSDEFENLRDAVQQHDASPADILAAGLSLQRSLTASLNAAATQPDEAQRIVALLREERELLLSAPQLKAPMMLDAANQLRGNADNVLAQLRSIADSTVLAKLPRSIVPEGQPTSSTSTIAAGGQPTVPVTPTTGSVATGAPEPSTSPTGTVTDPDPVASTSPTPTPTPSVPTETPEPTPTAPPSETPSPSDTPAPVPSDTPSPQESDPGLGSPLQNLIPLPSTFPGDLGNLLNNRTNDGGPTQSDPVTPASP